MVSKKNTNKYLLIKLISCDFKCDEIILAANSLILRIAYNHLLGSCLLCELIK